MINPTAKMKRMNAVKLTQGRDICVYPDSKLTDKGMLRFHALPTWAEINVHYADNTVKRMRKCDFEVSSNEIKLHRFIMKHFVD